MWGEGRFQFNYKSLGAGGAINKPRTHRDWTQVKEGLLILQSSQDSLRRTQRSISAGTVTSWDPCRQEGFVSGSPLSRPPLSPAQTRRATCERVKWRPAARFRVSGAGPEPGCLLGQGVGGCLWAHGRWPSAGGVDPSLLHPYRSRSCRLCALEYRLFYSEFASSEGFIYLGLKFTQTWQPRGETSGLCVTLGCGTSEWRGTSGGELAEQVG